MDDFGGKPTIFGNILIFEKQNDVLYCHGLPFLYLVHLSNQNKQSVKINISLHGITSDVTFVGIFDTW